MVESVPGLVCLQLLPYNCLSRPFPEVHLACCWNVEQQKRDTCPHTVVLIELVRVFTLVVYCPYWYVASMTWEYCLVRKKIYSLVFDISICQCDIIFPAVFEYCSN